MNYLAELVSLYKSTVEPGLVDFVRLLHHIVRLNERGGATKSHFLTPARTFQFP